MKYPTSSGNDLSLRIDLLRYVLIVGIVLLHSPPYVPITELAAHPTTFEWTRTFFQSVLFRLSVPILSCISAYLLFSGKTRSYTEILNKKGKTIFVPMLFWNAFAFALLYVAAVATHTPSEVYPFHLGTALDGMLGLTRAPWDYPLNFLRDLLVLLLLTPVLRLLLSRASYLGFALWFVIFFFDFDGPLVGRPDMPVTYALGALAAVRQWDLKRLDRFARPCLVLLFLLCAIMLVNRVADRKWFTIFTPFLIWPATSLVANSAFVKRWAPKLAAASFFIFLFHAFPLKAIATVLGKVPFVPFELAWFLAPALTVGLCHLLFSGLSRLCPRALGWVTGGRIARAAPRAPAAVPVPPTGVASASKQG
ncbi:acyltransferase family protein [Azohydromonas caseinilytica]|uniref:Acyltransferase n=1 Tax=Azohydromonas caseinilytica TaxID=2728836 RepID=A0A848FBD8_9BURK|nr:acyltransferase [Azohydromonas caseinilytica]NML15633.1 acyltransferase [Azohydromonas caseinilytica]